MFNLLPMVQMMPSQLPGGLTGPMPGLPGGMPMPMPGQGQPGMPQAMRPGMPGGTVTAPGMVNGAPMMNAAPPAPGAGAGQGGMMHGMAGLPPPPMAAGAGQGQDPMAQALMIAKMGQMGRSPQGGGGMMQPGGLLGGPAMLPGEKGTNTLPPWLSQMFQTSQPQQGVSPDQMANLPGLAPGNKFADIAPNANPIANGAAGIQMPWWLKGIFGG